MTDSDQTLPARLCAHDEPEPAATEVDPLDQLDYEVVCRINEQIDHLVRLGLDDDLSNPYLTLALIADRMGGVLAAVADVISTNYPVDVGEFGDTVGTITVWTDHPGMDRPLSASWELSSIDAGILMKHGDWSDGAIRIFDRAQLLPMMCSNTSAVPPEMRRIALNIDPRFRLPGAFLVKYQPFADEDEGGDDDG